jgi:hypothetical protein
MESRSSLEAQMERLRRLDEFRSVARGLSERGLAFLQHAGYGSKLTGWHDPGDNVERALLVNVSRWLPKGQQDVLASGFGLAALQSVSLDSLFNVDFGDYRTDHVPVLRAASILESLTHVDGGLLCKGALSCFVRIICALNTTGPTELVGGAGGGAPGTPQTALITFRCVRALAAVANKLEQTAEFALRLGELTKGPPPGTPAAWWEIHVRNIQLSLDIAKATLRPIVFEESGPRDAAIGARRTGGENSIVKWIQSEVGRLRVISKGLPHAEMSSAKNKATADFPDSGSLPLERALNALFGFQSCLHDAVASDDLATISKCLAAAAQQIRRHFAPVEVYLRSVLDHELATPSIQIQRVPDAAELLFAASGLSLIGSLDEEAIAAALDRVAPAMTDNGRLPSHKPFDVASKGYVLHVAASEVLQAFSDLAARVLYPIDNDTVRRMLTHFTETVQRFDAGNGWRHERDGSAGKCYWWLTALSVDALKSYEKLLDTRINEIVFSDLSVRRPHSLSLELSGLFYPDHAMVIANRDKDGIAVSFLKMWAHVSGVDVGLSKLHSAILFGPPGTGKTTLAEALAKSAMVPLVEITPSDILVGGEEGIETRARTVFEALSMVSNVVILMDEFDRVLWDRGQTGETASIFQFLTPGMLPKLKALHGHAKRQRTAFMLATNLIGGLDSAAIRGGRFDEQIGVYPPDALSRIGRLHSAWDCTVRLLHAKGSAMPTMRKRNGTKVFAERFAEAIKRTAGVAMDSLAKPGWYTADSQLRAGTLLGYLGGTAVPMWPGREKDLPPEPGSDYPPRAAKSPGEFPNAYARREWLEWLFITIIDKLPIGDAMKPECLRHTWQVIHSEQLFGDAVRERDEEQKRFPEKDVALRNIMIRLVEQKLSIHGS